MPRLILLGGLPGSGKSYYRRRVLEPEGWLCFDDFQRDARENSGDFWLAREYREVVAALREGRACVVADIRVITESYRLQSRVALSEAVGAIDVEVRLFNLDPEQCAENIRNDKDRARPDQIEARLRVLAEWTRRYQCPPDAVRVPVWRPEPQ
jgi:predicted kinase